MPVTWTHTQPADCYIYTYWNCGHNKPNANHTPTPYTIITNRERRSHVKYVWCQSVALTRRITSHTLWANISNWINSLVFFLFASLTSLSFFFLILCVFVFAFFSVISNIQMSDALGLSHRLIYIRYLHTVINWNTHLCANLCANVFECSQYCRNSMWYRQRGWIDDVLYGAIRFLIFKWLKEISYCVRDSPSSVACVVINQGSSSHLNKSLSLWTEIYHQIEIYRQIYCQIKIYRQNT